MISVRQKKRRNGLRENLRYLLSDTFITLSPSPFGKVAIVWTDEGVTPKVCRVFLPIKSTPVERLVKNTFPKAESKCCETIEQFGERIGRFLSGEAIQFDLDLIQLHLCPLFQRDVLLAEQEIPRGWVSTYWRIAAYLGKPTAACSVGTALAHNPFPVIIPCHRAIRSDHSLGGFQGGLVMKRRLLEYEGIEFSKRGKVVTDRVYF
jgi:methylated-DNA-[protein]-cysteine S-methyltransferase